MSASAAPLTELNGVDIRTWTGREPVPVLHDIALKIYPAERIHLIGARGSGKTQLLRAIAGIMPTSRGTRTTRKPVLALLGGGVTYDSTLSIEDNIRWHVASWGLSSAFGTAEFAKQAVEIAEIRLPAATARPEVLTPDEQIRLLAASALLARPQILAIDEVDERVDAQFGPWIAQRLPQLLRLDAALLVAGQWVTSIAPLITRRLHLANGRIEIDEAATPSVKTLS